MSEDPKQAVAEKPDAAVTPQAEGADARVQGDDLDALLNEFDTSTAAPVEAKPTPEQKPAVAIDPQQIAAQVKAEIEADTRFKTDMANAVKDVRGDLDPESFDDVFVESWINAQAVKDPRLAEAWKQRNSNPSQFKKVVSGLSQKLAKSIAKRPDPNATEDRDAVTAAVRGASTKAPEGKAPDFSKASNNEFRNEVEKQFGYTPNV